MATVTETKIKKFIKTSGIAGIPIAFFIVYYLVSLNAITMIGHSGDMNCAGTMSDPCLASITFKANEMITINPMNQTWLFRTDKGVKEIKVLNNDTYMNFSQTNKFYKNKNYTINFIGYKNDPLDTVKWSFGDVDPYWNPPTPDNYNITNTENLTFNESANDVTRNFQIFRYANVTAMSMNFTGFEWKNFSNYYDGVPFNQADLGSFPGYHNITRAIQGNMTIRGLTLDKMSMYFYKSDNNLSGNVSFKVRNSSNDQVIASCDMGSANSTQFDSFGQYGCDFADTPINGTVFFTLERDNVSSGHLIVIGDNPANLPGDSYTYFNDTKTWNFFSSSYEWTMNITFVESPLYPGNPSLSVNNTIAWNYSTPSTRMLSTFNDSSSSKDITLYTRQNSTSYFSLPKTSTAHSATFYMNATNKSDTFTQLPVDYSCDGSFSPGNPCSNAFDGNYATAPSTSGPANYSGNYSLYGGENQINWTIYTYTYSNTWCDTYYWNYTSNLWQYLYRANSTGSAGNLYNSTIIGLDGLGGSLRTQVRGNCTFYEGGIYHKFYGINNSWIEVGTVDGIREWNATTNFTGTTNNFSAAINTYLGTCTADSNGYCQVPFLLHSDTAGLFRISNINVTYTGDFSSFNTNVNSGDFSSVINTAINKGNCDCSTCALNGNNCKMNLTFHSDHAGILQYSLNTVDYTVLNTSVSLPNGTNTVSFYSNGMAANATEPSGQNSTIGIFNVSNQNNFNVSVYARINSTSSQSTLKINNISDWSKAFTLNTSNQKIINCSLQNNWSYLWLYADTTNSSNLCYQETANVSTCGNQNQSINPNGTYLYNNSLWSNLSAIIDGNWSTYSLPQIANVPADFYVKYQKPNYGYNATWQIKNGESTNTSFFGSFLGANGTSQNTNADSISNVFSNNLTWIKFNGVNNSINFTSTMVGIGNITACAWINITGYGGGPGKGRIFDNGKFQMLVYNDSFYKNRWGIASDGISTILTGTDDTISVNKWIYLCGVRYSNGTVNHYINGSFVAAAGGSSTPATGTNGMIIGNNLANTRQFNGSIDEVRIYNRTLSATEILNLYNSGRFKNSTINNTNLTMWISFDENVGSTINDNSGNLNTGTINGSTWQTDGLNNTLNLGTDYLFLNKDFTLINMNYAWSNLTLGLYNSTLTTTINMTIPTSCLRNPTYGRITSSGLSDCYQETANVSTSCGALSTGNYNLRWTDNGYAYYLIDGSWTTGYDIILAGDNLTINYSKMSGSTGVNWLIKDIGGNATLSVPSECFSQNPLSMRIFNYATDTPSYQCFNGSIYKNLTTRSATVIYEEAINWLFPAPTMTYYCRNNTNWQILSSDSSTGIFEEAIYWNMLSRQNTTWNPDIEVTTGEC